MKVIAVGGEPGSGKTSIMSKIVDHYDMIPHYSAVKLVPYLRVDNIYVLGKYEVNEVFSGTDRMSMAVQPEAIKFLENINKSVSNSIVLFEGDRLFNSSFLEFCVTKYDTSLIYLKTQKLIREERFKERGSNQNSTWLQGRETKVSNILTNFSLMFNIESMENNDIFDQEKIIEHIINVVDENNDSI